jgi:hypothetical protein
LAAKKYKKLTNAEKKIRKEIREKLREDGLIPAIKPKLNRYKFAKEVLEEYEKQEKYTFAGYVLHGIAYMLPSVEYKENITPEEIGVLKVLKLALEVKKFEEEIKAQGKTTYNAMELVEKVIEPIINL